MVFLIRRAGPFIPALAFATAGCAVVGWLGLAPRAETPRFPHVLHAEKGAECKDCHGGDLDDPAKRMPALASCLECHKDLDKDNPPPKRATVFFTEAGEVKRSRPLLLTGEVIFSHEAHAARTRLSCTECHGDRVKSDVSPEPPARMDACLACHARPGVADGIAGGDCALCHREIRKDREPPDHRRDWKHFHGPVVRAGSGRTGDNCSMCHTDDSCTKCHQEEAPRSHTGFWRYQGHGVAADLDRNGCAVCHRSDSCDRCHSETAPRNHTAAWGAPRDRHCLTCHEPLAGENCSVCHKDVRSHATATPMPAVPAHTPAMNCRQCHGVAQPMPHVDNGDSCVQCHQ